MGSDVAFDASRSDRSKVDRKINETWSATRQSPASGPTPPDSFPTDLLSDQSPRIRLPIQDLVIIAPFANFHLANLLLEPLKRPSKLAQIPTLLSPLSQVLSFRSPNSSRLLRQ